MSIEIMVTKINDYLIPATDVDKNALTNFKQGAAIRVKLVRSKDRSLQHHRLYWGGLIRLLDDYWTVETGYVSKYDKQVMTGLINWISSRGYSTDAIFSLTQLYLEDRASRIKARVPELHNSAMRLQMIHDWLKEESGCYDVFMTPTGPVKRVHSISFDSMPNQAEFNQFYKRVFNVAWHHVFRKCNFKNIEQAENLAMQMATMG